jgi:hypothetical protein
LEVINFLILGWLSDPEKPARLRRTREGQIRAVREPPVTEDHEAEPAGSMASALLPDGLSLPRCRVGVY